ncbi:MAG: hypothetical protein U9Q85_04030 [Patescibacteria group bacterium]|nr:hypothetical protein [Patescibacteria group bacterium]
MFEQFANPQFDISEDYRIIDQVLENEDIITELAAELLSLKQFRLNRNRCRC